MDAAAILLHERACGQKEAFCIFDALGCSAGRMKRCDMSFHMQTCGQQRAPMCFGSMDGCKYQAPSRSKFWEHHFHCPFIRAKTDIQDDDELFPLLR
jgi:hypothetical protein